MSGRQTLRFKIATEEREFELIHRLNYRTFVEELPQHEPTPTQRLVDQFHLENTYFICLKGPELLGMVAIRGIRPFSLDHKLHHLDLYLPEKRNLCEVRLLAIEKKYRHGQIFGGLLKLLFKHVKTHRYTLALISGNSRQEKLYRNLGFVPFGPMVGKAPVQFQPMYLTLERFEKRAKSFLTSAVTTTDAQEGISFLPGPVSIHPDVRAALNHPPISHRSTSFHSDLQSIKKLLCQLVNARRVEILLGSGTLANDVIAGQLSLENRPGLIVCNGEFGRRLIEHATRWGFCFDTIQVKWGEAFDYHIIRDRLDRSPQTGWLWAVHCETSTGVLNDLSELKSICAERKLKLCLDAISSIGITPVDLEGVYLASAVSGKGLASFPGLSMVFYHHAIIPSPNRLPRYLDLGFYAASQGVPFTQSSNLLQALYAALKRIERKRFDRVHQDTFWLRATLREAGFDVLAEERHSAPAVITLRLQPFLNSRSLGQELDQSGYLLSFGSEYLLQRNWVQICLMGEYSRESLVGLLRELVALRGCSEGQE